MSLFDCFSLSAPARVPEVIHLRYGRDCQVKVQINTVHWVKSVPTRNFHGPYFPVFSSNTEKYGLEKH